MSEAQLLADIQIEHSRGDVRLLRINSGNAWAGTIVDRTPTRLTLLNYHPVRLAPEGCADLLGWVRENERAVFVAIEGKSKTGRLTPEQTTFLQRVIGAGGHAGVARSVDDARRILHDWDRWPR